MKPHKQIKFEDVQNCYKWLFSKNSTKAKKHFNLKLVAICIEIATQF